MIDIQTKKMSELKAAKYNPRKDLREGDPEFEKLRNSMDAFGYVEPIVWNKRTGNIVGGHQRFKVRKAQGVESVDVSVVDLDDDHEKALNLALNKISGDWDAKKLDQLLGILSDDLIGLAGFEPEVPDDGIEEIPEVKFSEELLEEHNFLVLTCDNSVDWLQVETFFNLEPRRALHSKDNFLRIGRGRVINATKFFDKIGGQLNEADYEY